MKLHDVLPLVLGYPKIRKALLAEPKLNLDLALIAVSKTWDIDTIQVLLKKGANPSGSDHRGKNPLLAMFEGFIYSTRDKGRRFKCAKILLEAGADINYQNENGVTPLMEVAESDQNFTILNYFLNQNANPNLQELNGKTALMLASRNGQMKNIRALLKAKANPHLKNKAGNTALMEAASVDHHEAVQALLAAGSDYALANHEGKTAFMLAETYRKATKSQALLISSQYLQAAGATQ